MRGRTSLKLVGALVGVVALCAACDPGWTNPVLGTGTCGDTGDGGPATAAEIEVNSAPFGSGLRTDVAGNVYFTTGSGSGPDITIRRIDAATGMITTLPITVPDGVLLQGAAVDPDGSVVYEFYETDDGGQGRYEIHRYDKSTGDTLVAITDGDSASAGFVRVGPDHYVLFGSDSSGATRVDIYQGHVTKTPLPSSPELILCAAAPSGALYGITFESPNGIDGNHVFRLDPDNTLHVIAGTGSPDPGTGRQQGRALALNLSAQGVAVTHNGNLLVASAHAVYDLADPADVPAASTVPTGSPSTTPAPTTTTEPLRMS